MSLRHPVTNSKCMGIHMFVCIYRCVRRCVCKYCLLVCMNVVRTNCLFCTRGMCTYVQSVCMFTCLYISVDVCRSVYVNSDGVHIVCTNRFFALAVYVHMCGVYVYLCV